MPLTPQMIDAMNKASGGNVSLNGTSKPTSRADEIRALAKTATDSKSLVPGAQFGGSGSMGESIINTFKEGGKNVTKDATDIPVNAEKAGGSITAKTASILTGAGHVAGDIAGTAGGLIGDVFAPLIPKAVKDKVGDVSKLLTDKIHSIPGMTPDIAKSLGDVFNTLTLKGGEEATPVVKDAAKNAIEKGTQVVKDTTEKFATDPAKVAAKQSSFIDDLITPEMNKKATTTAIKTGKVTEGEGLMGKRDFGEAIPNLDKIKASVEKVPGISSKNTHLQNANLIHDEIGKTAESLKSQLQGKGFFSPSEFKGYMDTIKTTLKENPMIVGDAERTASKIVDKFNSLVKQHGYTPSGLLDARKALDQWMGSQKGNVFNPTTESAVSTALRAVRQGGNDFIASKVKDVPVKDMLEHQSNLYRAIDNIAPKAAKEAGSKLGRFTGFIKKHPYVTGAVGAVGADKILKGTTGLGL